MPSHNGTILPTVWYRYEDRIYAPPIDEFGDVCGKGRVEVLQRELRVIKFTPKGAWLDVGFGEKRFVLRNCRKRYACPTIAEAKESFRQRKLRQRGIYQARVDHADRCLRIIDLDFDHRKVVY